MSGSGLTIGPVSNSALTGALQAKGYKLKAIQLLQSVPQHLKNAKLVLAKTVETEQQIFA